MIKIVVLDGFTLNPGDLSWNALKDMGELTVFDRIEKNLASTLEAIGDAEIVITNKTPLTRGIMEKTTQVKYIGVLATGYNVVDIEAAREMGITVTNIPDYGTTSVAQFTFGLLLEMCHHIGAHNEAVQSGQWSQSSDFCFWNYPLIELAGKTMGIIGFGRIGQTTAKIAQAFGMKVLAYDRTWNSKSENGSCRFAAMEELLATSDVISLHCPLNKETQGIINKETLGKMKTGVMIINTARGPLINEEDLCNALLTGKVAGAAMDVVSVEPIDENNPLLKAKNCLITPHIAWAPKEARERLMRIAVENVSSFLNGSPRNVVN
jgi:glycerate dehydrogenase